MAPEWKPPKTAMQANSIAARRTIRVKSLAEYIRSNMGPEEFYSWLRDIASGKDPDAPEGSFQTPIEMRYRMMAMKMLLERAYGGVTQHVTLEQHDASSADKYRQLPEEKLRALRDTMRAMLAAPIDVKVEDK
jgi:hypothetical protein